MVYDNGEFSTNMENSCEILLIKMIVYVFSKTEGYVFVIRLLGTYICP